MYRENSVRKARGALWRLWMLGRKRGWLGVPFWLMMYRSYILPVLEYSAEVFGELLWPQAERVQLEAGRMILGVTKRTPNAVIRGELGLLTLKGRRDITRLMYWWKILNSKSGDLVRDVYDWSKATDGNNWCRYTMRLLTELGLEKEWRTEELGTKKEWAARVRERVCGRERQERGGRRWNRK